MKLKHSAWALALGLGVQSVQALPLVDLYAGAYLWRSDITGDLEAQSNSSDINLDWQDELGLSTGTSNMFMLGFEHALPIIPDFQIRHTNLTTDGDETINAQFEFGGETFAASDNLKTDLDLTHTDYSFYWGLPIPKTRINFGVTLRHFSGSVELESASGVKAKEDLNLVVPMGYARAELDIPATDLQVGAEINGVGFSGSSLIDFNIYGNYEFTVALLDIGLTAGYRSFNLDIDAKDFGGDDDDLAATAGIKGLYAGVTLHL